MKISNSIKTIMLITILLNYTNIFAQSPQSPEPDWRKQNAQIESIESNTAKKKADTAAQNASTQSQNANTATQNANTQSKNANTAAQNANTQSQNANTAAQNASTQSQNANTATQNANTQSQNANTAAQNANTMAIVVTAVPAPKEVTVVPAGFINCFVIKAGWFNGVWVPEHRVCKYNPSKEGIAWIEGYWACTNYKTTGNMKGECTKWDWKPGRWVRTFEVY